MADHTNAMNGDQITMGTTSEATEQDMSKPDSSSSDFLCNLVFNIALGLVTSCRKYVHWRSLCFGEGPGALVTPIKATGVVVWDLKMIVDKYCYTI